MKTEYALILGRFQPFHFGHQHIVNEALLDGKKPIILIGSTNEDRDLKNNPLSFEERKEIIETIYPNNEVIILSLNDYLSWDDWFRVILTKINLITTSDNVTFYYFNKEVDRCDFIFNDKEYKNEFYTVLFEDLYNMKEIDFYKQEGLKVDSNARDIRENIEKFKHFLDARIYWKLKNKGW